MKRSLKLKPCPEADKMLVAYRMVKVFDKEDELINEGGSTFIETVSR